MSKFKFVPIKYGVDFNPQLPPETEIHLDASSSKEAWNKLALIVDDTDSWEISK